MQGNMNMERWIKCEEFYTQGLYFKLIYKYYTVHINVQYHL